MICEPEMGHSPLLMEGWQQKAAFVIQFRPETDIAAGQIAGKVEHIASCQAVRFHSLDELLRFMAAVLEEVSNTKNESHP
jgi:hypothetical protein